MSGCPSSLTKQPLSINLGTQEFWNWTQGSGIRSLNSTTELLSHPQIFLSAWFPTMLKFWIAGISWKMRKNIFFARSVSSGRNYLEVAEVSLVMRWEMLHPLCQDWRGSRGPKGWGDRLGRVAILASASVKALNIIISLRTNGCINWLILVHWSIGDLATWHLQHQRTSRMKIWLKILGSPSNKGFGPVTFSIYPKII